MGVIGQRHRGPGPCVEEQLTRLAELQSQEELVASREQAEDEGAVDAVRAYTEDHQQVGPDAGRQNGEERGLDLRPLGEDDPRSERDDSSWK